MLLLITLSTSCFAQLDTQRIAMNAKFWIIPELNQFYMTSDDMLDFVQKPLEIEFVESKGFFNLVFFRIKPQEVGRCTQENGDIIFKEIPLFKNYSNELIMAYSPSGENFYRISGFKNSDLEFLIHCGFFVYPCDWWKRSYKCLWIEGVDVRKLLKKGCR